MIERVAATRATRPPARLQLTFACELDAARLTALVADATVLEALHRLGARVTLMLSDFSPARADAVRALNAARIPVVGIPLMPYEDGYYFTIDNASRALARYDEWRAWTARHGLVWAAWAWISNPRRVSTSRSCGTPGGSCRCFPHASSPDAGFARHGGSARRGARLASATPVGVHDACRGVSWRRSEELITRAAGQGRTERFVNANSRLDARARAR